MKLENLLDLDLRKLRNYDEALEILLRTWQEQSCPIEEGKLARILGRRGFFQNFVRTIDSSGNPPHIDSQKIVSH